MRVVVEHLRGGLMRGGAHHGEGAKFVGYVGDAFGVDLLGLAERPAHFENCALVLRHPSLPGGDAFLLLFLPFSRRQCVPGSEFRTGLAAEENGEIGVVAHESLLISCLSMIFSENRFTLFRIMLVSASRSSVRQSRRRLPAHPAGNRTFPAPGGSR